MLKTKIIYLGFMILTFASGAIIAGIWLASRHNAETEKIAEAKLNETKNLEPKNQTSGRKEQDFYQLSESEREYRSDHTIRPRSEYSGIIGRLSEFVNLFGKSKTNTFYISKVESDDDGNPETNDEYVYVYWKEDKGILILYPPFDVEDVAYYDWVYAMRRLNLAEGIVETEDEVGNSDHKVTRVFAKKLLDKCVNHGTKVVIDKTKFKNQEIKK